MLDRSIPTKEALVHSIPISEVKDMKSDVLWALMASLSEKFFEPHLWPQFWQFSRKKNCIDFGFLSATCPPLGLIFLKYFRDLSTIPFFLSSHIHSYLLIFSFILNFLIRFQLTSLRYYKLHQLRSKHISIENSKKMKSQPKTGFEKPCFWTLNIMILQSMKFLIMDFCGDIL